MPLLPLTATHYPPWLTGGPQTPENLEKGYFVRPTVFADVDNPMTLAQEEIFGPVLSIIPFDTEDQAVHIANDSPYGLAGGVWSADPQSRWKLSGDKSVLLTTTIPSFRKSIRTTDVFFVELEP